MLKGIVTGLASWRVEKFYAEEHKYWSLCLFRAGRPPPTPRLLDGTRTGAFKDVSRGDAAKARPVALSVGSHISVRFCGVRIRCGFVFFFEIRIQVAGMYMLEWWHAKRFVRHPSSGMSHWHRPFR